MQIHEPDAPFVKGAVLLVDGSSEIQPSYAQELTDRLNAAGYSVFSLPEIDVLTGDELSALLREAKHQIPSTMNLSLFAFGDAGPGAWRALEQVKGLVSTAFLVSCALPGEQIDFAALSSIGVRGVYASDSMSYTSSYWRAHLAMRDLDTPHDFLIYGGGIDDRFYEDPAPTAKATWAETMTAAVDWLTIWETAASAKPMHHQ